MQIIRIIIYLFVLFVVSLFEEPRITILLRQVFPSDFSRAFSYAIPLLVVAVAILAAGKPEWKTYSNASVVSFGVILVLSYGNTVFNSINQLKAEKAAEISDLKKSIDSKRAELKKPAAVRYCPAPNPVAENYSELLSGYQSCLYAQNAENQNSQKQTASLYREIEVSTAELEKLQNASFDLLDWTKPVTQGAAGIFLSIILSVTTSLFCLSLAKELNDFAFEAGISDEGKLAVYLSEGYSVRQIAEFLEISKSAADRRIKEFRTVQEFRTVSAKNGIGNSRNSMNENHYAGNTYKNGSVPGLGQQRDSRGTDWDTAGTETGQAKNRAKTEDREKDRNSSVFDSVFDSGFAGRMA